MKYAYLVLCASLAGGCVGNEISFTIDRFVHMDSTTMCAATPTAMVGLSSGLLDVGVVANSSSEGYVAAPVVGNHLIEMANATSAELNAIFVTGFDVQLKPDPTVAGAVPPAQLNFFIQAAGGRITPGAEVAVPIEVIPRQVAVELGGSVPAGTTNRPFVTVHIRPVGSRAGSGMSGAWTDLPIQLCSFCLMQPSTPCPAGGFPTAAVQLGGCFPQQDDATTCCTQNGVVLCGAAVPMSKM
jgi:hypothetical protein